MFVERRQSGIEKGQIVGVGSDRSQRLAGIDSRRAPNARVGDLCKRGSSHEKGCDCER
jgi:hypothetical protein